MAELRFDGRVAIVTGAGRGIGRAHALLLASRGAAVVVNDFGGEQDGSGGSSTPADEVVAEIVRSGGQAVASTSSVAEPDGAASIAATALDAFGRIDIVINNAGIFAPGALPSLTAADFRRMVDVHFFGTVNVVKAAWSHLLAAGSGRIVNTISEAMLGAPQMTSYGAAKGAIFGFTRNLAVESAGTGLLANCIAPRAGTRMVDRLGAALELPTDMVEQMKLAMPPEYVVPVAAYLAHESCELNGECLQVGSGRVSRLAVVESVGIAVEETTPEIVAANLPTILDLTSATERGALVPEPLPS